MKIKVKKQVDALENFKPKEETKLIEDKSNNQLKAAIIFNELINKRKDFMKELHDKVDYDNLKFEYVGPTKDVSFYEHKGSKELFNAIKDNQINFDDVVKRQNEILNKISNTKIGKKLQNKKKRLITLKNFTLLEKKLLIFLEKIVLDAAYKSKQNETKGRGLKILTPKQMLQRLPIALPQVKAGNNSENLLNEIRQIVYSLYQSKQITKNVYNNLIKSL